MKKAGNCCFCCLWLLFSILSHWMWLLYHSQDSTIPFCSSAKSLLYRVLPSVCVRMRCWSLFGISFLLLHTIRTVRYTIRCVCFCKQLRSIDWLIDRSIACSLARSVFGFGAYHLRSHRHFCSHSTSHHQSLFCCCFSFGWKWEIVFVHDLEFFHNGIAISLRKSFCMAMRMCMYFIASKCFMYIWIR